ncbi:hypothetical protein [Phenylobacterium soli]|uniref:Uncharacterized protein n=1 Tax=Phenylobacterium soli TaxID=2170551 RepID=A0A328AGN3_9CAUL|nr:hypothetical protein [Phenylobacterium soli]RAK54023.1 hypothetical protein DJ017_05535 [Phenylobacterium soli]
MRPHLVLSSLLAVAALGACAAQPMARPGEDKGMGRAVQQPMRDLSLIRDAAPPVLTRAVAEPYDREQVKTCAQVTHELAELDTALGPDLKPGDKPGSGLSIGGLAADLVGGAIGLPFRGVVRHVTGAEQRDRALRAAVLAGMVRRGFLKGRLAEMTCEPPPAPTTTASANAGP